MRVPKNAFLSVYTPEAKHAFEQMLSGFTDWNSFEQVVTMIHNLDEYTPLSDQQRLNVIALSNFRPTQEVSPKYVDLYGKEALICLDPPQLLDLAQDGLDHIVISEGITYFHFSDGSIQANEESSTPPRLDAINLIRMIMENRRKA